MSQHLSGPVAMGHPVVAVGHPVLPARPMRLLHTAQQRQPTAFHDDDEDLPLSQRAFDPWMWILCPLMLVPLLLLFAAEAASWPALDTATETPWLPPSLCSLGDGRFVSYMPPSNSPSSDRSTAHTDGVDTRGVLPADQARGPIPPDPACPSDVHDPRALSFVLPESMQGWPSLGSNVSLVVYHGEGFSCTLRGVNLRDADGRLLLSAEEVLLPPSTEQFQGRPMRGLALILQMTPGAHGETEASRSLHGHDNGNSSFISGTSRNNSSDMGSGTSSSPYKLLRRGRQLNAPRRPGRALKGGGGGGHGHRGGGGGYTTSVHRPATALPRYSYAPSSATAYGRHTRHAVAVGTAVFVAHHGGGYGRYYDMRGCGNYASGGCTARVVEPLSRDTLTSGTGTFIASESLAFPLTLSLASVEVQMSRPTAAHDAPISAPASAAASPSVFFTLYSPTGAPGAEGSGASTTEGLRGLIWLPIWLSLYSALRYPLELDKSHGMCTVLFVATALCGTGFQVQLWLTGAW